MTDTSDSTVTSLFKSWRAGDSESGQLLAQRVSDWFYAVCSSKYGENEGHHIFQSVSQKFGEGIVSVAHSNDLVSWAHQLLTDETQQGDLATFKGNDASPYSGGHPPLTLLLKAKSALPGEVALLSAFYSGSPEGDVNAMALELGGMPSALLHARYSVKGWLKNNYDLPFKVVPAEANMDLFPLPMYEADRMTTPAEMSGFEKWMLDNVDLCQDVAEFAPFAGALRSGVPANAAEATENHAASNSDQAPQKMRLGVTEFVLVIGIALVLISFSVFAFIAATSVE